MKPLPDDLHVNDVGQWLEGGWFLFQREAHSAPEPGQLYHIDGEDAYEVSDIEGETHPLVHANVFPFWPECGAINLDGFAAYLTRHQSRQYRRTYNDRCLTVSIPRKWDAMKRYGTESINLTPNSHSVVQAAFSPTYFTFSDAVDKIARERWFSVAMNPHLILAGTDNNYLLYYRGQLIAKIADGKITAISAQDAQIRRLLKFFEGRVNL